MGPGSRWSESFTLLCEPGCAVLPVPAWWHQGERFCRGRELLDANRRGRGALVLCQPRLCCRACCTSEGLKLLAGGRENPAGAWLPASGPPGSSIKELDGPGALWGSQAASLQGGHEAPARLGPELRSVPTGCFGREAVMGGNEAEISPVAAGEVASEVGQPQLQRPLARSCSEHPSVTSWQGAGVLGTASFPTTNPTCLHQQRASSPVVTVFC